MNQTWVDQKIKEFQDEVSHIKEELIESITNRYDLEDSDRRNLLSALNVDNWSYEQMVKFEMIRFCGFHHYFKKGTSYDELEKDPGYIDFQRWAAETRRKAQRIYDYWIYNKGQGIYQRYLDSQPKFFEGDIIITDPCYITREPATLEEEDDWRVCNYGDDMDALGLKTWMTRTTIYGDWSCHTFNVDTDEPIGQFCADAGLVGVFLLDEVLQYNPEYNDHIEKEWTTTLIKDFKGTVQFIVNEHTGTWEDDSEFHKKGDTWVDYEVQVIGEGVNRITGEPIRFITKQTGL